MHKKFTPNPYDRGDTTRMGRALCLNIHGIIAEQAEHNTHIGKIKVAVSH